MQFISNSSRVIKNLDQFYFTTLFANFQHHQQQSSMHPPSYNNYDHGSHTHHSHHQGAWQQPQGMTHTAPPPGVEHPHPPPAPSTIVYNDKPAQGSHLPPPAPQPQPSRPALWNPAISHTTPSNTSGQPQLSIYFLVHLYFLSHKKLCPVYLMLFLKLLFRCNIYCDQISSIKAGFFHEKIDCQSSRKRLANKSK